MAKVHKNRYNFDFNKNFRIAHLRLKSIDNSYQLNMVCESTSLLKQSLKYYTASEYFKT